MMVASIATPGMNSKLWQMVKRQGEACCALHKVQKIEKKLKTEAQEAGLNMF